MPRSKRRLVYRPEWTATSPAAEARRAEVAAEAEATAAEAERVRTVARELRRAEADRRRRENRAKRRREKGRGPQAQVIAMTSVRVPEGLREWRRTWKVDDADDRAQDAELARLEAERRRR